MVTGKQNWGVWLSLAGVLMGGACVMPEGEEDDSTIELTTGAATATVLITGSVRDSSAARLPVPGVFANLTGAATHSAVTDSNGVYQFNVPAGSYAVRVSKPGATFSPTTTGTFTASANLERSFRCVTGCEGAAVVNPLKELVIVDPTVVNDARARNNSTNRSWSFRFMMEQMAPTGVDPSDFVMNWLQGFKSSAGPINGFPVEDRFVEAFLISPWPKLSNGKLDLARSPFRLLAIVNRTDLHRDGVGEGRFVYGLVDSTGFGQSFTVIFEYRLPTTRLRNEWISEFHALTAVGFGGTFNTRLQTLTDKFTRRGTTPAKPNGSSISQVRSNEIQLGGPWQLREFHLIKNASGQGFLKLAPVAMTPNPTLNDSAGVANYIRNNAVRVRHGLATVPANLIGGESNEIEPWSFPNFPAVTEANRHAFAGQTCNGCHNGETPNLEGFYQITPNVDVVSGSTGTERLSGFILDSELPRRRRFVQNRLICSNSADCSPGAEALAF